MDKLDLRYLEQRESIMAELGAAAECRHAYTLENGCWVCRTAGRVSLPEPTVDPASTRSKV